MYARVYSFILLTCSQIVRLDRAEIEEMILTTHAEADQVRALSRVFLFMMFGALVLCEDFSRARVSKASHLSFYSCSVTGRVCCKALTSIFLSLKQITRISERSEKEELVREASEAREVRRNQKNHIIIVSLSSLFVEGGDIRARS